jgi:hypothetical protein
LVTTPPSLSKEAAVMKRSIMVVWLALSMLASSVVGAESISVCGVLVQEVLGFN